MKFLVDEGVEARVVKRLRSEGHDVAYIAELQPGLTDSEVLKLAGDESRILVTVDKDFGELVYRLRNLSTGVLLVRLSGLSSDEKASIVGRVVLDHGDEMFGAFTVVSPGLVRVRTPE